MLPVSIYIYESIIISENTHKGQGQRNANPYSLYFAVSMILVIVSKPNHTINNVRCDRETLETINF